MLDIASIIAQQKINMQTFGICGNLPKNAIYSLSILRSSEERASAVVREYL